FWAISVDLKDFIQTQHGVPNTCIPVDNLALFLEADQCDLRWMRVVGWAGRSGDQSIGRGDARYFGR
ncbi:MAG: hypothetical protein MK481_11670, partial [SAR324 cluster bacterium]|nr:hypothetical protein [SAR324 cluster bacterium]